jgi:SAM-dependent methyltransferase
MALSLARIAPPLFLLVVAAGCPGKNGGPPRHYDDPRAMIEVFEDPERDAWQQPERVVDAIPAPAKAGTVADIGAGSGYFTRRLAMLVPEGRVYAVDVDGEFEDYLLENREGWGTPNIEPHLAHYDDPMLPEGALDIVFSANTYAFIRNRVPYFTKVRSTLTAEGRLVLLDFRPDATPPEGIAPAPQHRVSAEVAKRELAEAGFQVEAEESFLPHQWFLVLRPSS